ncbi:HpcH/HpaI aldolase/citrate lyase family protein [Fodinicola feengrottensis]|uniref:HpcH/HpaI aldolase/citrate lyase family protein n=1 Tax=Fodinicola feengrottensis TaxID=435914 RepID=A0ABP4U9U8_9ACTN|nr:HpcH/HpaI aldolase/citrate lyase family protein [Fodinicola feengrottensis]
MRHFALLTESERSALFHREPVPFHRDSERSVLAVALGATLYAPATRPRLTEDIRKQASRGVASMVICLEDAISQDEVPAAEYNAIEQLQAYRNSTEEGPLLFVRVRMPEQIVDLTKRLGDAVDVLTGFVLPKFTGDLGAEFLEALAKASANSGHRLLGMPVLESPDIIHRETRVDSLARISRMLDEHRENVLAIRIGATDLCSAYGLRRPRGMPIYDIRLVADAIADVVNVLGRADGTGYVVTGPVWEYFDPSNAMFDQRLPEEAFEAKRSKRVYKQIIDRDLEGLLHEIELDKANGLVGKTVIHPSHVAAVHALSVVTHEEYVDAQDILATLGGGVRASEYANKMNEANPHRAWADRTLTRARVFGVTNPDVSWVDVLGAVLSPVAS